MSKKCKAYSESKLGLEPPDNRKAFYAGWEAALRDAIAEATIKDNLIVEPVAYVTGYSKGYATVQPIDPCLLMPVGMALYRSPPKREPLTEEKISALELPPSGTATVRDLVRLIERAHGIRGEG